ncbi:CynX/NimT family MFS transporter [Telmatospirillum siberiense]|nr:MFS transporter [Telmatospirillum siberiense]
MNIRKHHGAGGHGGFLILSALVTLALILRSPLTAIAPIVNDLRQGLAISAVTIGLLTSIPILCFGMLTPLASWLIGRAGIEASIFVTLAGAALGMIVRSSGGAGLALFGTLILGAALTIGNIVCLMVIARDFPQRTRMVTGIYTSALNVGTMMTSAVTAPLAGLVGWRVALAAVTVLVIPGIALWIAASSRGVATVPRHHAESGPPALRPAKTQASEVPPPPVRRRPIAWLLVIAFSTHLFIYYGITAWLPAYLIQADGMNASEAGLVASVFQILALLGSFGAPALAGRAPLPWLLVVMAVCWIITPLGLLMAPHGWIIWSITGGIATGGGFTVVFMLIMNHAHDLQDNRRISAFVQGIGYSLSSVGPLVIGSLNQTFGGWTAGFLLLSATAVVMLGSGLCVTRIKTSRIAASNGS